MRGGDADKNPWNEGNGWKTPGKYKETGGEVKEEGKEEDSGRWDKEEEEEEEEEEAK